MGAYTLDIFRYCYRLLDINQRSDNKISFPLDTLYDQLRIKAAPFLESITEEKIQLIETCFEKEPFEVLISWIERDFLDSNAHLSLSQEEFGEYFRLSLPLAEVLFRKLSEKPYFSTEKIYWADADYAERLLIKDKSILNIAWVKYNLEPEEATFLLDSFGRKNQLTRENIPARDGNVIQLELTPYSAAGISYSRGRGAIESLPKELITLKKLQVLDIKALGIQHLFPELRQLKDLRVKSSQWGNVELVIEEALSLKDLTAKIEVWTWDSTDVSIRNGHIITLDLRNCQLHEIPYEIMKFRFLTELKLGLNSIQELPLFLTDLRYLEKLDLSKNSLNDLPKNIFQLQHLKGLNVSNNAIKDISEKISLLKSLEELNLLGNKIQALPSSLMKLPNLRKLCISSEIPLSQHIEQLIHNQDLIIYLNRWIKYTHSSYWTKYEIRASEIVNLQNFIQQEKFNHLSLKLKNEFIEGCSIGNIEIKKLSNEIYPFPKLKLLSLTKCNLSSIPDVVGRFERLEELKLSSNELTIIPQCIFSLENLKVLDFGDNPITEIPKEISNLKSLEQLLLSHNNDLTKLPSSIIKLKDLQTLDLVGTPIDNLPKELEKNKSLLIKLTGWSGPFIHYQDYLFIKELTELPQWNRKRRVKEIDSGHIIRLDLSNLELQKLSDSIAALSELKELNLSNNNLSSIPISINKLKSLEFLILDSNQIKELPIEITSLSKLRYLSIKNNQLVEFPKLMENLQHLQKISFTKNKFDYFPDFLFHFDSIYIESDLWIGYIDEVKEYQLVISFFSEIKRQIKLDKILISNGVVKDLNLAGLRLKSIPNSIGLFTSLERLDLSSNSLDRLPKLISSLKNLETLLLNSNNFKEVPEEVYFLKGLQNLEISDCPLETISPKIGSLLELRTLKIQKTPLSIIPNEIGSLKKLAVLDVTNSKNIVFPESLNTFSSLEIYFYPDFFPLCNCSEVRFFLDLQRILERENIKLHYLKARIEIKHGHIISLDLSKTSKHIPLLITVPDSIGDLKWLKNLSLDGNQIEHLPHSIGRLKELRKLSVRNNLLASVLEVVGDLIQLEELVLSKNRLTILPESFTRLINLKKLYIADNPINSSLRHLTNLKNVEILEISHQQGKYLPVELYNFPHLRILSNCWDVKRERSKPYGNAILAREARIFLQGFPGACSKGKMVLGADSEDHVISLSYTSYSHHYIEKIPEAIGDLSHLRQIFLTEQRLKELPESIGNLKQLNHLDLSNNQLTHLPESLGRLKGLKVLNLAYNRLRGLPSSIGELQNLEVLNLDSNELQSLPPSFEHLVSLEYLTLSQNKLEEFPQVLFILASKKLKILSIEGNIFQTFPEQIKTISRKVWLGALSRHISGFRAKPRAIKKPESSPDKYFDLLHEELDIDPLEVEFLKDMNLRLNKGRVKVFNSHIVSLNLSAMNLKEIKETINNLTNIEELTLTGNALRDLPTTFKELNFLKVLNLSANQFSELPSNICSLKKLETLDLSRNLLREVPECVNSLISLKHLHLQENWIQTISPLTSLTRLTNLDLQYNLLSCLPELPLKVQTKADIWLTQKVGRKESRFIIDLIENYILLLELKEEYRWNKLPNLRGIVNSLKNPSCMTIAANSITKIHLNNLKLSSFPSSLNSLINLNELILHNIQVRNEPDYVLDLPKLSKLSINLCPKIVLGIAKDFTKLPAITEIILSNNEINTFPESIKYLTTLKKLSLSNNAIEVLPEWIGEKLESLEELDITNNYLEALPENLKDLVSLKTFHLGGNKFKTIPRQVFDTLGMKSLKLTDIDLIPLSRFIDFVSYLAETDTFYDLNSVQSIVNYIEKIEQTDEASCRELNEQMINKMNEDPKSWISSILGLFIIASDHGRKLFLEQDNTAALLKGIIYEVVQDYEYRDEFLYESLPKLVETNKDEQKFLDILLAVKSNLDQIDSEYNIFGTPAVVAFLSQLDRFSLNTDQKIIELIDKILGLSLSASFWRQQWNNLSSIVSDLIPESMLGEYDGYYEKDERLSNALGECSICTLSEWPTVEVCTYCEQTICCGFTVYEHDDENNQICETICDSCFLNKGMEELQAIDSIDTSLDRETWKAIINLPIHESEKEERIEFLQNLQILEGLLDQKDASLLSKVLRKKISTIVEHGINTGEEEYYHDCEETRRMEWTSEYDLYFYREHLEDRCFSCGASCERIHWKKSPLCCIHGDIDSEKYCEYCKRRVSECAWCGGKCKEIGGYRLPEKICCICTYSDETDFREKGCVTCQARKREKLSSDTRIETEDCPYCHQKKEIIQFFRDDYRSTYLCKVCNRIIEKLYDEEYGEYKYQEKAVNELFETAIESFNYYTRKEKIVLPYDFIQKLFQHLYTNCTLELNLERQILLVIDPKNKKELFKFQFTYHFWHFYTYPSLKKELWIGYYPITPKTNDQINQYLTQFAEMK